MESYAEIREKIMLTYDKGYSKLLNPVVESHCYSQAQLKNYINYAKILSDDLVYKFSKLEQQKSVYTAHYISRIESVKEVLEKISQKVRFLQLKIRKQDELIQNRLDTYKNFPNEGDAILERRNSESEVSNDQGQKSSNQILRNLEWMTKILFWKGHVSKDNSRIPLTSSEYSVEKCFLAPQDFGELVLKSQGVNINPTWVATEALIKVLVKMEIAIGGILQRPNNSDYSELFYRSEYLRSYEDTLHEIVFTNNDEVFYLE